MDSSSRTLGTPDAPARARPGSHRAARFLGGGRIELVEIPTRSPESSEVRFRVEGCGVCASNLPFWEGREWFDYPGEPGAPGHEAWGVVDEIGAEVEGIRPGDRVAALGHHGFAEVDHARAGRIVRLPDDLHGAPFPGEPLGCAVNVLRRAEIHEGARVAVVGTGFLGTLLVALARRAGAEVYAISRRRTSLLAARRFGALETIPLDEPDGVVERVQELTGGALCSRVLEVTGRAGPLALASRLTAVRGRLVVAGYHQEGPRQVDLQLWNWRGLDVVNAHERDPGIYMEGIREATRLFGPGAIDPGPLYSHALPLDRIEEAFALSADRPEGFTKALVTMP